MFIPADMMQVPLNAWLARKMIALLPLDEATWARGRGWTLWKALIVYAGLPGTDSRAAAESRRVIEEELADHALAV
jgi:aminoglycoside phosphotransferase (APT) family kinase protein